MDLGDNAVLGIAKGSSVTAGYLTPQGNITAWLNEPAFAPVDYRDGAPADDGPATAASALNVARSRWWAGFWRPLAQSRAPSA